MIAVRAAAIESNLRQAVGLGCAISGGVAGLRWGHGDFRERMWGDYGSLGYAASLQDAGCLFGVYLGFHPGLVFVARFGAS
jgi:hypothetical protein